MNHEIYIPPEERDRDICSPSVIETHVATRNDEDEEEDVVLPEPVSGRKHRLKVKMGKAKHRHHFCKMIREEQIKQKENWLLEKKRKRIGAAAEDRKKKRIIEERKKAHFHIILFIPLGLYVHLKFIEYIYLH